MSDLLYRIDPGGKHTIRLLLEERGAFRKRILYFSTLKELAKEAEKPLLQQLIGAKRRAHPGTSLETLSFQQIELDPVLALELLEPLAKTGRLFFESMPIEQVCKGKIHWEGESFGDACRLEGFLWTDAKIPFNAVRWSFATLSSVAALVERSLIVFPYSGSLRWIEMARSGVFALEGSAKRRFLDEEFSVSWKKKEEIPLTVFPELHLHDRTGCFADLWMEYPGVGRVAFGDLAPLVGTRKRLTLEEKQWEKDLLEAGYLRKQVGRSPYYCPGEAAADALSLLFDVGWKVMDVNRKPAVRFSDWECELREEGNEIVLRVSPALQGALKAVKEKKCWFDLGETSAWIDRKEAHRLFGDLIEEEWGEGEELRLPKRRLAACIGLSGEVKARWQKDLKEAVERLGCPEKLETALPDASFQGELLAYQQKGLDWLFFLHRFGFGGLLADEMGLGKTVQFLAFFSLLRTNLPTLIVAPTSLLYHWKAEFRRFLPGARVLMHSGSGRSQELSDLRGASFVLTSYAILRQDIELFSKLEFEAAVLDESNAIKNSDTLTSKAALKLNARARFCLSGTPIENRLSELASQFAFLMPDLLDHKDSSESMQRKSSPFLLRRRKKDVQIDLPDKIEAIAWVEMAKEQKLIYEEFQSSALKRIKPKVVEDGAAAHRMEILEAILRLRQICCDPRLVGRDATSAKLGLLMDDLHDLLGQGSKALVYSQFTSMLDSIESACRAEGWKVLRIDGSTPVEKRGAAVEEFQKSEEPIVFLLSLKAGGVGLNLTAADYVLLFDPWWNEAVEKQAVDRAHRIGRKKTVFTKKYLTPNSIEEKMLGMKEVKQSAADRILDGGTHAEEEMSADEWLELLT